jgi:predicted nucleic acid-binding protein
MEALLLDTTVLSFLFREGPKNDLAKRYESITRGKISMISFQSVAELWKWAEESEWGLQRRNRLENFIQKFQIIPVDYELSRTWARV